MPDPILLRSALFPVIFGLFGGVATASPSRLCDDAARTAAAQTDVPLAILRAITLAETGHTARDTAAFGPWPWAVQADSRGHWFADQASAIAYTKSLMALGKTNIDIGCYQLNLHWHSAEFKSIEEMFSPENNALYAATFLDRLYRETGDWRMAVGRYHSRDGDRAEAYLQRLEQLFDRNLAGRRGLPASGVSQPGPTHVAEKFGLVAARGPLIEPNRRASPLIGGMP
jgi:hypothetical protein